MIARRSNAGVECSVVEICGARHVFAAVVPRAGETLAQQAEDVLEGIERLSRQQQMQGSIVAQSVFLSDFDDRAACGRMLGDFYGRDWPATAYIAQPPCEGKRLAVEVWGVGRGRGEVEIQRAGDGLVLVRHDGIALAHVAHHHCLSAAESVYGGSLAALRSLSSRLASAGFRFDEVVRTWFYLGNITAAEEETTRYHRLNRARTEFYRGRQFAAGLVPARWRQPAFPASTAIGARGADLTVGCLAMRADRSNVVLLPLENPQQTSAYDYADRLAVETPKFSRAVALIGGDLAVVLISGTASITTSQSRHLGDVQQQTRQTLDNIEALVAAENFRRRGFPGLGATLGDLACARVYVKRPEDYAPVRAICQERLGDVPAIYAVGDLCRPELLVEIEGIAFSRGQGSGGSTHCSCRFCHSERSEESPWRRGDSSLRSE